MEVPSSLPTRSGPNVDLNGTSSHIGDKPLIFFDLETTGLAHTSDIVQIAAVSGARTFGVYVVPSEPIHPDASRVTGLTVVENALHHHGQPVATSSIQDALQAFLQFIQEFENPMLVAHNGRNFDVPILRHQVQLLDMAAVFGKSIAGFVDTIEIARNKIRRYSLPSQSYRQDSLVQDLLGKSYEAHNALADAALLQELYELKLALTATEASPYVFSY